MAHAINNILIRQETNKNTGKITLNSFDSISRYKEYLVVIGTVNLAAGRHDARVHLN